jgi:hypothetical protein
MLRPFALSYHIPGTLSANITITWKAPFDCTLRHISAVASNDSDATLIAGTSGDTNGYLESTTIGDSGTPSEFERGDFDGALVSGDEVRISDGDVVVLTLDYDGSGGTAAQNVTIVAILDEG